MECIVIGERVYRIKHKSLEHIEAALVDWNRLTDEAIKISSRAYIKAYREALGIPTDISIDDEAAFIHKTYGVKPYESQEFVDKLHDALGYKRGKLPDFVAWLRERDIEASVETNIFMIDEEVNNG